MEKSFVFGERLEKFDEIFRKDVAYDFIKSSKKEGPHPLALSTDDIVFWKNHIWGSEASK